VIASNMWWSPVRGLTLLAALVVLPSVYADTLWTDALPTNGNSGFDAAVLEGSFPPPYILGDQFSLAGESDITSVTVYEVGNTPVRKLQDVATDTPGTEFSDISLYLGADGTDLALAADNTYTYAEVQYGGQNYESINSPGTYYPIFAITFSGLNVNLAAGLNDFAISATPIGSNTFALLMSDPARSGVGNTEDSTSLSPNNSFLYYTFDGTSWIATYQYGPGSISGYSASGALDANSIILGSPATIPEPSTLGLLGMGLAGVWAGLRRRARNPRV